jgi:hypothetical protein
MERAELSEIAESDLDDVAAFLRRQSPSTAYDRAVLDWFLVRNPAREPGLPLGWIARDPSGAAIGTKVCSPQRFHAGGRSHLFLMGGGYFVAPEARGVGLLLMRRLLTLGERHVLFAATMNDVSGAIYEHFGGYPIPDSEHELIGVLRWPPVLEEWLVRRLPRPWLARAAAAPGALRPAAVRGRAADAARFARLEAHDLAALRIETAAEQIPRIHAERDARFLRWRYFERGDPSAELLLFDAARGPALVAVDLRPRGHRGQIRALRVLDLWGPLTDADLGGVARGLAARYRGRADVVVIRGQPAERQRALIGSGFVRRPLSRAIGVCIDRAGLLPTHDWCLAQADGDMAL